MHSFGIPKTDPSKEDSDAVSDSRRHGFGLTPRQSPAPSSREARVRHERATGRSRDAPVAADHFRDELEDRASPVPSRAWCHLLRGDAWLRQSPPRRSPIVSVPLHGQLGTPVPTPCVSSRIQQFIVREWNLQTCTTQRFVLLPRRWVVERSFAWMARFRRLARDYERLSDTLAGMHFIAFACLMLKNFLSELLEVHNTL